MKYVVIFFSPKYCELNGFQVASHPHRLFETREDAETNVATLKYLGMIAQAYRLEPLDQPRDASGRFRKRTLSVEMAA